MRDLDCREANLVLPRQLVAFRIDELDGLVPKLADMATAGA